MLASNLLFFIISCIVLVLSGFWLVKSLSIMSRFLKLSEFIIAFVIMAVSTSLPELFVGISAAIAKNTAISLGTVIGSNIADVTLVGGIMVLIGREIKVKSRLIKRDSASMILISLIPIALMLIGKQISRIDGMILIAVFVIYSWWMIKKRNKFTKTFENRIGRWQAVISTFLFIVSLVVLFLSAKFVVQYGSALALDLFLAPIGIGLFFIAFGTSLPELVFESTAARTGHGEMALGDLIGSVVANSTLVLGVTAIIYPITADFLLYLTSIIFMIVAISIFTVFIQAGSKIRWKEGIVLLMFYILFLVVELNIKQYLA